MEAGFKVVCTIKGNQANLLPTMACSYFWFEAHILLLLAPFIFDHHCKKVCEKMDE
jgi:hypothetical protein